MLLEERYVDFICESGLTQNQFLLLYLTYKKRLDLILKYKQRFPTEDGTMIGKFWIDDLVTKGFIVMEGNKGTITLKFKQIFCNKIDIAEELIDAYPSTMEIQGKIVPLTAIDIIVVADLYIEKILDNRQEHEEVLKDLAYAVKNNMINVSIKNFILGKYWLSIRKKRKSTTDDSHIAQQHNSFGA